MQETRVRSLCREDPLEKEMASHSSTLSWRTPWREEPGRLQSMGSQRVGHYWATSLSLSLCMLMLLLAVCVYVSNTRMSICYINRYTCIADVHMYVGMIYLKYEYNFFLSNLKWHYKTPSHFTCDYFNISPLQEDLCRPPYCYDTHAAVVCVPGGS